MWRAPVRHIFIQMIAVGEDSTATVWNRNRGQRLKGAFIWPKAGMNC